MRFGLRTRSVLVLAGDVIIFYASLALTLALRYGAQFSDHLSAHLTPFSLLLFPWLAVFFIAGLYDLKRLRNTIDFLQTLGASLAVNAFIAVLFFYFIPFFGIAPKTNLFIFLAIFALTLLLWRRAYNRGAAGGTATQILLLGTTPSISLLHDFIYQNPQLGYVIHAWIKTDTLPEEYRERRTFAAYIQEHGIDYVVIPRLLAKDPETSKTFYNLLYSRATLIDLPAFYELLLQKVPLEEVSEEWFLEHLARHYRFYDDLKRGVEFLAALALQTVVLVPELVIALLIKLSSSGPVIYKQVRIGKDEQPFALYKFRSMRQDAEKDGARWSGANDNRVTWIGKILRHSHLDELPQLWNILKGEVSFIGPRPERPEFISLLKEAVPYYEIRHLVKPGITGWAQINYRYGSSVEDTKHKLEYDIYYLKNRSITLDFSILIRTFKSFFIKSE